MMNSKKKLFLNLILVTIFVAMLVITIKTSLESNLFVVYPSLFIIPWFKATIVDFYFNQLILYGLVVYLEKKLIYTIPWLILFLVLGSMGTALYFLYYINFRNSSLKVSQSL
ncbi:MAG: DUF1475 family protein [Bacteriovoracaceae bacterium]